MHRFLNDFIKILHNVSIYIFKHISDTKKKYLMYIKAINTKSDHFDDSMKD